MRDVGDERPARVLDPIERVSEVIFGLLMAMTFIGSVSVATAGREEVRTMMIAAIGCNLAWGLADAVMYLVRTLTERTRSRTLLARLRGGADAATGRAIIAETLPHGIAAVASAEFLEGLRRDLVEGPVQPRHSRLGPDDFKAAFGVFLLVVLSTFPLVIPFILIDEPWTAVRLSNLVALAMLFAGGWLLASYAGGSRWRGGAAMALVGAGLVGAIMALGG